MNYIIQELYIDKWEDIFKSDLNNCRDFVTSLRKKYPLGVYRIVRVYV